MKVTQAVLDDIKRTTDQWRASDEKWDAGLPTEFPDVKRYDNISYGPAGEENLLDVYTPKDVTQSVPTIIDIHGGGERIRVQRALSALLPWLGETWIWRC